MSAATILGMGSACLDTLIEVRRIPEPGGKAEVLSEQRLPGGQVASVLVGCVRLGLKAAMLLRTGDDEAGERIRKGLTAGGVDLTHARVRAGVASATAYILRDREGQRSVIWHAPAGLAVSAGEIAPSMLDNMAALFFDGRDGAACLKAARLARRRGIPVVADLDEVYPHTTELLPLIDHLISPAEFKLAQSAACPTVVVTLGVGGAEGWERGGARHHCPSFATNVVDTTGAGDAFHAGYLFALMQGWPLARRMRFANATASLACEAVGSQAGLPTRAEVETRLALRSASLGHRAPRASASTSGTRAAGTLGPAPRKADRI